MFETILSNFHLEKVLWIFRVKLKYIILVSILFALGAGAYADYSRTSTYIAQISFYVYSNPDYITDSTVNINSSDFTQARNLLSSYMQILRSKTFLGKVQEETGIPFSISYLRSCISASTIENTPVFVVSVYNPDPLNAMNIANAIGNLAPDEITRIVKSGGIEILDKAELPTVPYQSTSVTKLAVIGGIGGFGLATLLFLLRGLLDTTVRKKYEIQDMFKIPILGDVPQLPTPTKRKPFNKTLNQESPFALREAYNNIRANLLFTGRGEKCPIYAVTSADTAEGKTLNTINLAVSYMQLEKNVLVIDADMRKSSMSILLGLEEGEGLSEYLAQVIDKPNIKKTLDNLSVISAGYIPPNPAELLSKSEMETLIDQVRLEYDFIIVDNAPVALVTDGFILSRLADLNIFILRYGFSQKSQVELINQYASKEMVSNPAILVNDIKFNTFGSSYYKNYQYEAYQNTYYSDEAKKEKEKEKRKKQKEKSNLTI